MLSAIIATHESERALVPTLAALVPGATHGLLTEAVVADADSRDATEEVADIAGCRFLRSTEPLGVRLKAAALSTRTPWLLFLRAGTVPDPGWVEAADHFIQMAGGLGTRERAAMFRPLGAVEPMRPTLTEVFALLRAAFGGARPGHGLLISRRLYDSVGGHAAAADPEAALLRTLGRRRLAMLACGARAPATPHT